MKTFQFGNIKVWLFKIRQNEWLFTREQHGRAQKIIPFPNERSAVLHYQTELLNISYQEKNGAN